MKLSAFPSQFLSFRSLWVLAALAGVGTYAVLDTNAYPTGITGVTQKPGSVNGCTCHCANSNAATTVTVTTSAPSFAPSTAYTFTATVANGGESAGGVNIATYTGNGLSVISGQGLYLSVGELTHQSPKTFSGGSCSWNFTYTTGSSAGWDTIYATGNAVNGDGLNGGGNCSDNWNNAAKYVIHVVAAPSLPQRIALGRNAVSLGQLRVGRRKADSLLVSSTGQQTITITSSALKSGVAFSAYPTGTNRSLSPNTTEVDSIIFQPTTRGTFSDSLIFTTNSDTIPERRLAVFVSGQGIQAAFTSTNGTTLAFGNLRINQTKQMAFLYQNTGDDTLFLQTPSIPESGFTIASGPSHLTLAPNQVDSIVVEFAPTANQAYSGTLNFTASNNIPVPSVSLTGTVSHAVFTGINGTSLAFGNLHVNGTGRKPFIYQNTGDDTLFLQTPTISGAGFTIVSGPTHLTLAPNQLDTVIVQFAPTSKQPYSGALHLTGLNNVTIPSISLTGTGTLPQIQASSSANLGSIRLNQVLSGTVQINNSGNDILHISNAVLTQTGAVKFALGSYDAQVPAGGTGTFHINYLPSQEGLDSVTLHFSTDDPTDTAVTILITASGITPHMSVNDHDTVNFGDVKIGDTTSRDFVIDNSGTDNLTIQSVTVSPTPPFSVVSFPQLVNSGGSSAATIHFIPVDTGIFNGTIVLAGDDPNVPFDTIYIVGTGINSSLSVPANVNYGSIPVGTSVNQSLTLSNTGTASIRILSYKLTSPEKVFELIDTVASVSTGSSGTITVKFTPADAIDYKGSLLLTTDDANTPVRIISLSGQGVKGKLSWAPTTLDFSNIDTGKSATMTAWLHNTGNAAITVNSFTITGSSAYSHSTATTPAVMSPGDSISIGVTFAPTVSGSQDATLNAVLADQSQVQLTLHGNGIIPTSNVTVLPNASTGFGVTVSPNPANSAARIYVHSDRPAIVQVHVFDASGREMIAKNLGISSVGSSQFELVTSILPSGSYFMRVTGSNGEVAETRLIIEQ